MTDAIKNKVEQAAKEKYPSTFYSDTGKQSDVEERLIKELADNGTDYQRELFLKYQEEKNNQLEKVIADMLILEVHLKNKNTNRIKTKSECLSDNGFSCKNLELYQHAQLEKAMEEYACQPLTK